MSVVLEFIIFIVGLFGIAACVGRICHEGDYDDFD